MRQTGLSIVGLLVVSGVTAAVWTVASGGSSLAVAEPSRACDYVNDPANELDGEQSWFQEFDYPGGFGDGERIVITIEEPATGEATDVRVLPRRLQENLRRSVTSLPMTFEVWGFGGSGEMRWELVPPDGVATVTWHSECIPRPSMSVAAECRNEVGVITLSIEDQAASMYGVYVEPLDPQPNVMSVAGEVAVFEFGPVGDGRHEVVVEPVEDGRIELIWQDLEVACATVPTATTTATTPVSAPATTAAPPAAPTSAVQVDATLPETGAVGNQAALVIALGLAFVGAAMLGIVRRRPASSHS